MGYCKECPIPCCKDGLDQQITTLKEQFREKELSVAVFSLIPAWIVVYHHNVPSASFIKRLFNRPDRVMDQVQIDKPEDCPRRMMPVGVVIKSN